MYHYQGITLIPSCNTKMIIRQVLLWFLGKRIPKFTKHYKTTYPQHKESDQISNILRQTDSIEYSVLTRSFALAPIS